MKTGAIRESS